MDEPRLLHDPLRMSESEYTLYVQRMLDLAAELPVASRGRIVAALVQANERWLRVMRPGLFADASEAVSADPGHA